MRHWPEDPHGSMVPMLEASIEAAKLRHPSGKKEVAVMNGLTVSDRCDRCGAAAVYQVALDVAELLFCMHHHRKHFPAMQALGWTVALANPDLVAQYAQEVA